MFCPSCGSKEDHTNQFCRACGTNLSSVRVMMESADSFATSALSARDEIGRAVAAKIQHTNDASELSEFAENVLPEIEKFLESPEERRLRRIRSGSMVSFIGLGVAIGFFIASQIGDPEVIFFSALGLVTLFIGLSLITNGLFFTVPNKQLNENESSRFDNKSQANVLNKTTNDLLMPPNAQSEFSSVTEHTTKHLNNKKPV